MSTTCQFLIIDDSSDILFLLQQNLLKHFKSTITLAKSGSDAINIIKLGFVFDLIICDLHMPNGNGKSVFEFLQNLENPPPFILYTSAVELPNLTGNNFLGVVTKGRQQEIVSLIQTKVDLKNHIK